MAVYFMPRDRNNFWWGGGRGGGGVLDLIGQALIQPMLQRDALARQYNYDNRLAQQKHDLDLAMKNAEWDRRDYEARRFIEGYNRDPRRSAGGGEMLAFLPGLGYKGNVSDVAQWALPQMATIDQGNQKTVAPIYSGGFIGNGETYDMGLSPKEAADVAIAKRGADLAERKFADESARNWYIARQTARGGGKAPDPFAGIKSAADLYEALSKFNQGGDGGIPGVSSMGGNGAQTPDKLAGTYDLAQYFLRGAIAQALGQAPQGASSFEDVLSANGGLFGGPTLGYYNGGVQPDTDMEDTATIVPGRTPGGEDPEYLGKLGLNPRGWAALAEPAPQISDEAVRRYSQKWGISEEDARNELSQFVSM